MPIIKSAKKRVKVNAKAAIRNSKTKRTLRDAVKSFHAALKGGNSTKISDAKNKATSAIDTAAKKNIIHKNKAARKKSQLSTAAKKSGAKPMKAAPKAKAKVAVKKAAPAKKAVAAKKPAAKKVVAKKAPAKKK